MIGSISVSSLFIAATICVVNIFLGLLVFSRNPKLLLNRLFLTFTILLSLWATSSIISDSTTLYELSRWTSQLAFSFSFLGIVFIWLFSTEFAQKKWLSKKLLLMLLALSVPISILFGTKLVYNLVSIDKSTQGVLYGPYLLSMVMLLILTVRNFIGLMRRGDELQKSQTKFIMSGLAVMVAAALTTNAVLPLVVPSSADALTKLGPLFTIFFTSSVAFAIVKHKLFDIRAFVARATVYIFSIGVIALLYSLVLYGIGPLLFGINDLKNSDRVFFATLALIIALTYAPIIKFFNKLTRQLFFRDSYDNQDVLDKLGKVIVGSIDLHKIQRGAIEVLEAALKPTYMTFLMLNSVEGSHVKELHGQQWQDGASGSLQRTLKKLGTKLTLYDELTEKESHVKTVLRTEDISLVAPLVTKEGIVGYLVAGPKKSGNIYNAQDTGLMGVVANELAVALRNAQQFEEIQAFNVTLQEKVTEATRELKMTNKKLIALDEAKDEFISMASHQLRTPLTSIKGYLSMMVEGDLGKVTPPQEKALKEAFGSSQRMVFLIADFLNVSRIKTGKFVIETKEVDLPEVVREELTQLREMADSRDLKLVYEQPEVFPKVMLDDNKIRQVMMNMVDNAIYYTPTGGTITIQLYATGDEVVFKVIDTGIGVPKAEQHKLFAKFYRAGNARKARPDGTGLGLFMAQKIVVEQGGAIIFESAEGKGSTFGFHFPLSKIKA